MQCPRCGLQNQPGISACARCGLPVHLPPAGSQSTRQGPPPAGVPPYAPASQPTGQPGRPAGWQQPPVGPPPGWSHPGTPGAGYPPAGPGQPPGQSPGSGPSGSTAIGERSGDFRGSAPYAAPSPYAAPNPAGPVGWGAPASSTASSTGRTGRLATTVALALAALLSLAYAIWAFTARRGIFSDFAAGHLVGVGEAKANDRTDAILLVAAGVVVLVALALWLMRRLAGETTGGLLDNLGLALAVLGAVVAVAGLFLASRVSSATAQTVSGDRGVTASLVTGSGFALLAIGLIMGLLAVLGSRSRASTTPATAAGYAGW